MSQLLIAIIIRLGLIFFSEYQDENFSVKYTDIDYWVYTDAAKYLSENGSPYDRHTYRYTPILAYMMLPNVYLYQSFGKILFSLSDILCALVIKKLLNLTTHLDNNAIQGLVSLWLFDPIIINVSTRGSADSIISFLVLLTIYFLVKKRFIVAAIFFGLCVHFKIYPILYALPFYLYIDRSFPKKPQPNFFTKNRIQFTLISASTFIILLAYFYWQYDYVFLYETYLYHFIRKDNRHNFSVYFYYIYLNFENMSKVKSILAFLPQLILVGLSGFKFYRDLPFCIFVQTFLFVTFNKVCTAQYLIWFMVFIPLIMQNNYLYQTSKKKLIFMVAIQFISQMLWNLGAYYLEMEGKNVFIYIWSASLLFFAVNIWIILQLINYHQPKDFHEVSKINKDKLE